MDSVDVKNLTPNDSPSTYEDLELCKKNGEVRKWAKTPFAADDTINKKVILYDGSIELLRAEAIVNPTNECLTQLDFVNKLAGPELETYIRKKVRLCATGDVKLTPGFKSNYKYIIHAVPPKYQPKYKTAAETALFHTYFRILETMIEKKIRTVVMPTLATAKCSIPIEHNYHLQMRTIRRILERKPNDFDKIVILIREDDSTKVPFFHYFPRNKLDEELTCYRFTGTIGGPNGEPVIPEREIRIKSKPSVVSPNEQSIDLTSGLDLSTCVGKTAFSKMHDDLDKQRSTLKNGSANQSQVAVRKPVFRGCTLL